MFARSILGLSLLATSLTAQVPAPPAPEQQIAAAVSALPTEERGGATVLGYDAAGKLVTLRKGSGEMTCLGHNPKDDTFHVACYHNAMEPFMARGRALRESGVTGAQVQPGAVGRGQSTTGERGHRLTVPARAPAPTQREPR